MHLSKGAIYIGIIVYSVAILVIEDWPVMLATTGTVSLMWLFKMGIDIAFAGMATVRLIGPSLFADDEADDEVAIHEDDLHFSDTALFGLFLLNLVGNIMTVMTIGAQSFYYNLWSMAEAIAIFFSWILWSHAVKVQRKAARKAAMKRCPICDWPMADDPKDGCVDGNCSYRPDPQRSPDEYARVQRNRKVLAARQSKRLDPEGGIPGRQL